MDQYDHKQIEKKWQERWNEARLYETPDKVEGKENFYALIEFPYPSGNLHIGHWYAFVVPDMFARRKRMEGKNVLFPIGFDSFGLPAENAAIKRGLSPRKWTYDNIDFMKGQLRATGNAFDWSRSFATSDPEYYKWDQWLFLRLFEKGLAYKKKALVNWCPSCMTVLANEQVVDGHCERCGTEVEQRDLEQWFFKTTAYAERLLNDLDPLNWPENVKDLQRNWIGKSVGAEIDFELVFKKHPEHNEWRGPNGKKAHISVFTTRPDTLFGATYLVLAPEHPWVRAVWDTNHDDAVENKDEIVAYVKAAGKKSEIERTAEGREKTGVELKGVKAINPATGEEIPIFVADYVLAHYGTGAIMAVPAHDERDYEFAKKYDLPIRQVIAPRLTQIIEPGAFRPDEPMEIRNGVIALVKHWSEDKYLGLRWNGVAWGTLLTGGIEDGASPEETVLKEIKEETGYLHSKIVRSLGIVDGLFYHVPKEENRLTRGHVFYVELEDGEQEAITQEESEKHELVWLTLEELNAFLTPATHVFIASEFPQGEHPFLGNGTVINSGDFTNLESMDAKQKITKSVDGKMVTTYKMRDWLLSRQRYWGCPIPIVYDPEGNPYPVPDEHLPWKLPEDVTDFAPKGTSPIGTSKELIERTEHIFGKGWKPEIDTMDTFVDSSWYFLRYLDPHNDKEFASLEKQKAWMPINRYSGGAEHTTMHVLYSRFFQKALFDLGLATVEEPYLERYNRGIILAEDGRKMSKRWGNVVDPDEQVEKVGADTVRMYLGFIGPYQEVGSYPWSFGGIVGVRRFLEKVWRLNEKVVERVSERDAAGSQADKKLTALFHQTIKKVGEDIDAFKFNTAISALMILCNEFEKQAEISAEMYNTLLILLAPFAPHMAEELWEIRGNSFSIHCHEWPAFDPSRIESDTKTVAIQIAGKTRATIELPAGSGESEAVNAAQALPEIKARLDGREIVRIIYVPDRLINFVLGS